MPFAGPHLPELSRTRLFAVPRVPMPASKLDAALRRATPRYAAPRRAAPRHTALRHATAFLVLGPGTVQRFWFL